MAADHDFWVVFDLTSDASGDANDTIDIHGLIKAIYVDYAADVAAGCDVTVAGVIGGTTMTFATETDNNTDGYMTLDVDPIPAGGGIKVTIADAGDTKNVKVICLVV